MRDESGQRGQAPDPPPAAPPPQRGAGTTTRRLGLALVVLLSIPWALAVARRLASPADPPAA